MHDEDQGSAARLRGEGLLQALTTAEKVALAGGIDTWHTVRVDRLGLPSIKLSDGPSGVRGGTFGAVASAAFPCGSALGATWNTVLLEEVGQALGREARWKGARVLLGPTINIQRHPLGGRHFECYSEDPHLTARLAVAYIHGVQSQGVAATAKHFVGNDSEHQRHTISSNISERALREIYLVPFEAAIVEAGVWALMTAYNRINGTYAAEHELLRSLVKGEWDFDGLVMSDWWGTMSTVPSARAGLDLEMPGPPIHFGTALAEAVDSGAVTATELDDKARRLLRLAERVDAFDDPAEMQERAIDDPAHRALLRRAAAEGMVLLVNDGLLPLSPTPGRLGVIGPLADQLSMQGGGSAYVEPHRVASLLGTLRALSEGEVPYEAGCRIFRLPPPLDSNMSTERDGDSFPGARVEYFTNPDLEGPPVLTQFRRRLHLIWLGDPQPGKVEGQFSARVSSTLVAPEDGHYRFTLTSAGKSRLLLEGSIVVTNWEAWTRGSSFYGSGSSEVEGTVELRAGQSYQLVLEYQAPETPGIRGVTLGCRPPEAPDLLERAVRLAEQVERVVLVVGTTAETEKEGADRLSLALPGQQDELVRRVVAANPNTVVVVNAGSPVAMPWADEVRALLWTWFPGQQGDEAMADVLFGQADPGGRLPVSLPRRVQDCPADLSYPGELGQLDYCDGVFPGYRGYLRRGIAPHFAFGQGLSYTTFDLAPMEVDRETFGPEDSVTVTVEVANTGAKSGSQVVQLYVSDPASELLRPERELKAFAKVHLAPGERTSVTWTLDPRAFAAWHPGHQAWVVEPGEFELHLGTSAVDIAQRRAITCRPDRD